MDEFTALFSRKGMTFEEAVAYKSYLSNERGKSPARDDADATAAMNKVTAMPY